jgi:hypothetical protein
LAEYTGFAVDSGCVLTTIVDGEIVVRRGSKKTRGIVSALTAFDKYLHIDPDFKMYNIFDDTKDVLFQVSWHSNRNVLFEVAAFITEAKCRSLMLSRFQRIPSSNFLSSTQQLTTTSVICWNVELVVFSTNPNLQRVINGCKVFWRRLCMIFYRLYLIQWTEHPFGPASC